jgi:hypothetical protein
MDVLCPLIIVVAIIIAVVVAAGQKEALEEAQRAYRTCLERLKADPTNPNLRQEVLHLGRVYSNLTRNKMGVTVYDEVALQNDIDAACAGAVSMPAKSVEERLAKLGELLKAGHISEQEHRERRQKILDEI